MPGSVGLVITEGVLLDVRSAGRPRGVPWLGAPGAIEAWSKVVASVHEAAGTILCQLWHRGPGAERDVALSPSGVDA